MMHFQITHGWDHLDDLATPKCNNLKGTIVFLQTSGNWQLYVQSGQLYSAGSRGRWSIRKEMRVLTWQKWQSAASFNMSSEWTVSSTSSSTVRPSVGITCINQISGVIPVQEHIQSNYIKSTIWKFMPKYELSIILIYFPQSLGSSQQHTVTANC